MSCSNPTERFQQYAGKSPEDAGFYWTGGPLPVGEGVWFASMFSGVTAFDTTAGVVLVDTGLRSMAPALAQLLRQKLQAPIHTAIYTHGHVDHAFGLKAFLAPEQPDPEIVGHCNMPARFERYALTASHNQALNARQFGGAAEPGNNMSDLSDFGFPPMPPTRLYDGELTLSVGDRTFELFHAKGETDDHTWVFCPELGVLCPGDLFIWAVPNAGNPQKAQRYPWKWAEALRTMAAKQPRTMCPGHGGPVVDDPKLIQRMLGDTASFLEQIVERTLACMEKGSPPQIDVLRSVEIPRSDAPWLKPIYDEGEFIIRTVMRFYGGWYSGRPSELKPVPRASLALEVVALAGGVATLMARVKRLTEAGDLALACHLADYALEAASEDEAVRDQVAHLYETRAVGETSLMAINLFRSAAAYARAGRPYA